MKKWSTTTIGMVSFIVITILLATFYLKVIAPHDSSNPNRSEGVQSLSVYLTKDISEFNYTLAGNNLSKCGYTPDVQGKSAYWNWFIQVKWMIPDKEYAQKYVSNLTLTFYGYESNDTNTSRSYAQVGFGSAIMVEGSAKKEKDKELAKQAVYEIAAIIGVPLDWKRHIYVIAWMTMTSEGVYEEK